MSHLLGALAQCFRQPAIGMGSQQGDQRASIDRVPTGARNGAAAAGIFAAMLLAALSLWTAIPLSWVYIASKVARSQFPSAGPYMVVIAGIVASVAAVGFLIARLNRLYVRITGTNRVQPMRPSWLRSMRDAEPVASGMTVVEAVMMGSVALAALIFAAWFFLLAGSPLPNQ
jgi:hypothetical protein